MRNMLKKLMTIFTAGALAVSGAASLAACAGSFKHVSGIPNGEVTSNGGFVVEKGEYVYFINGVESYTSDNTYGIPVKGSLMRITKSDLSAGKNTAEIVIPSLMVAADYSSGIYVYGDRVYYATPNNVKSTSGKIESDYLVFQSAKLDGTDIQDYFNLADNATTYRYVEVDGKVYLMYVNSSELHSYNTKDKEDVTLVKDMGSYVLNSEDKGDPYVYYTMGVTMDIDVVGGSLARAYNQVYRVRADATESPYSELNNYEWNQAYLDENDGEIPYWNYGTLVFDGIGSIYASNPTIFSHDAKNTATDDFKTTAGFTYSLQSYTNDGIYFIRKDLTTTGSVGEDGWLYYLAESKLTSGWNSIKGNDVSNLDIVAQPSDTANASASAVFYIENNTHHYIYVSDSNLFRADVDEDGVVTALRIAQGVGTATLVGIDNTSDSAYHYVYYTVSGSNGGNIWRAVYNGSEDDYKSLGYDASKPYRPVQILDVQHANSWYDFEIIDSTLFYADAAALGSTSYTYISTVNLKANGKLMNNVELEEYNEKYNETVGSEGYLAELNTDGKTTLSTAIRYYYYTGETQQFYDNIKEAEEQTGKENTLYSEEEVKEFEEYTKGGHDLRSDYIFEIGQKSESDLEAIANYWQNTLQHYTYPAEEDEGLPAWAWVLIGIAIGVVVVGAGVAVFLVLRSRKQEAVVEEEKMFVDTTDDKDVDVYADEPAVSSEENVEEAPVEEASDEEVAEEAPVEDEPVEAVEDGGAEAEESAPEEHEESEQPAEHTEE